MRRDQKKYVAWQRHCESMWRGEIVFMRLFSLVETRRTKRTQKECNEYINNRHSRRATLLMRNHIRNCNKNSISFRRLNRPRYLLKTECEQWTLPTDCFTCFDTEKRETNTNKFRFSWLYLYSNYFCWMKCIVLYFITLTETFDRNCIENYLILFKMHLH